MPTPSTAAYAVILPALNEAEHIAGVIQAIRGQGVDVLVVDDGSQDNTASIARNEGAVVISHERNRGKGVALHTGFQEARKRGYQAVLTLDADGQHDPAEIRDFIGIHEKTGIPVLIGNRMAHPDGMPPIRRMTNRFMSWLLCRQMRQFVPDTQNGFRLYACKILPLVLPESPGFAAESEILLNIDHWGFRMGSVPVKVIYGNERSKIRPLCDTRRFFRMLFTFSRNRNKR